MRVLVTGHKGYIGTVLMPMLRQAGHEVVGLDSDLYRHCTLGYMPNHVPELIKDIRDVEPDDLAGFDAVVHLAGLSNDPLGDLNPELTYEINYKASVRLAEIAKSQRVRRFLFSSSCSTYGAGGDDFLTEEATFNPVTPYGQSKVMVEKDVAQLADESFSPTFLRNATAYGFSPRLRFDLVLNNLTAWAYTTGKVHLKSDGTAWRPIVHIEDISRAFIAILHAPIERVHNQAFNVGLTSENYLVRDIAQFVKHLVPDSEIEFADAAPTDKRNYRVNCDKIRSYVPAYQPKWIAPKGVAQIYQACKIHRIQLEAFEGPAFKRVDHIRHLLKTGRLDESLRWVQKDG